MLKHSRGELAVLWIAVAFYLGILGDGWGAFLSSSAPICHDEKHDQYNAEANQESCPVVYRVLVIGTRGDRQGIGFFIDDNKDAIGALATVFIALFTFTLWRATHNLWDVAAGQYDLIEAQSKLSKIIERAYIATEPGGIRPFDSARVGDKRIACDVVFINAGNLPAENVRWGIEHTYSEDPEEKQFDPATLRMVEHGIIIPPRGRAVKGSDPTTRAIFATKRDEGEDGKAWLCVWGRVIYSDGFVDWRSIDFCHRYNLRGAIGFTIPAENGRHHEFGNRVRR